MSYGSCHTVAAVLDFLRNSPAGNEALEFIFGDLVEEFTGNETRILAALSPFTLPVEPKRISTRCRTAARSTFQRSLSSMAPHARSL